MAPASASFAIVVPESNFGFFAIGREYGPSPLAAPGEDEEPPPPPPPALPGAPPAVGAATTTAATADGGDGECRRVAPCSHQRSSLFSWCCAPSPRPPSARGSWRGSPGPGRSA